MPTSTSASAFDLVLGSVLLGGGLAWLALRGRIDRAYERGHSDRVEDVSALKQEVSALEQEAESRSSRLSARSMRDWHPSGLKVVGVRGASLRAALIRTALFQNPSGRKRLSYDYG